MAVLVGRSVVVIGLVAVCSELENDVLLVLVEVPKTTELVLGPVM